VGGETQKSPKSEPQNVDCRMQNRKSHLRFCGLLDQIGKTNYYVFGLISPCLGENTQTGRVFFS
jgi:hypothetical protein